MERISVIVPVYKTEAYLDRCIQSIVDQTYTHLEIILVDDGSPDNCPQMCDAWAQKDSRICVIHKENGGLSDARNVGVAVAGGEYIAFVDSDDWISQRYIEKLHDAICESGIKLAACGVKFVFAEHEAKNVRSVNASPVIYSAEQALSPDGWKQIRAVAWNKLYHCSLLEGEVYPIGRCHEDEFVTYRLVDRAGSVALIEDELYFYYQREGSIMSSFSVKRLDAMDAYIERLKLFKTKYPKLYIQEKAQCCIAIAGLYLRAYESGCANMKAVSQKLTACRQDLLFEFSDWKHYSIKQLAYIWGTGLSLPLFCRILYKRRGNRI